LVDPNTDSYTSDILAVVQLCCGAAKCGRTARTWRPISEPCPSSDDISSMVYYFRWPPRK